MAFYRRWKLWWQWICTWSVISVAISDQKIIHLIRQGTMTVLLPQKCQKSVILQIPPCRHFCFGINIFQTFLCCYFHIYYSLTICPNNQSYFVNEVCFLGRNATSQMNGFSSPLNSLGLFQTPLSWGKSCSFNDHFPSPSSLLLPGREDSDDLKLTLKGDGELSLLEEGLKIARQYGMSALDEDSNKVEKVLKRQLHT